MNRNALTYAMTAGLAGQLVMVILGHYVAFVRDNLFAILGLVISALAGALYARLARPAGWPGVLAGGLLAGGICAFLGIAVSVVLQDVPPAVLAFGTLGSAAAGMVGAAAAKLVR